MISLTNQGKIRIKRQLLETECNIAASHLEERKREEEKAVCQIRKNPKYFYAYARSKATIKTTVGPFVIDKRQIDNPKEKAETLRKQFESVFIRDNDEMSVEEDLPNVPLMSNITFSEEDIVNSIKELRPHAAAGPDEVPAVLLKNCIASLKMPIKLLWETSLQKGEIPKILKSGLISPIYKGGDRSLPQNYRPVSLTSHITKIFEKIVVKYINEFLTSNNLFNENQHGFRNGRSCLSQLLAHQNLIIEGLEDGWDVDVIYLDFAKAFDKVHHGILIRKIKEIGIRGKVLNWLKAFLSNRVQNISVEGTLSEESHVISGVPQGTVLGPLLFLIHISDINKEVRNSRVSSFADDTRILKIIKEPSDRSILQEDLNVVYDWSKNNKMQFNDSKFEMIRYTLRGEQTTSPYLAPDSTIIEQKSQIKDLGVSLNNDVTFSGNICEKVSCAKRKTGWILRTFTSRDKVTMLTLLKSLVIPQVEYCCQLWNPNKISEIQSIEYIQKSFTKKITGMNDKNYWERLKALNLYSLERRRERYIVIYVWKIVNGKVPNIDSRNRIITKQTRNGIQCARPPLITSSMDRIKTCKDNSFFGKAPKLFNCMPKEIREHNGKLETFKKKLDKFLQNVPDQPGFHDQTYAREAQSNSLIHQIQNMQLQGIRGGFTSSLSRS